MVGSERITAAQPLGGLEEIIFEVLHSSKVSFCLTTQFWGRIPAVLRCAVFLCSVSAASPLLKINMLTVVCCSLLSGFDTGSEASRPAAADVRSMQGIAAFCPGVQVWPSGGLGGLTALRQWRVCARGACPSSSIAHDAPYRHGLRHARAVKSRAVCRLVREQYFTSVNVPGAFR